MSTVNVQQSDVILDGEPNQDIIKKFGGMVEEVVATTIRAASEPEKIQQYFRLRRNDVYYKGEQYTVPTFLYNNQVDFVPLSTAEGMSPRGESPGDDSFLNDYVLNVYRGDIRKLVAVLGQRPPNVNAVALRPLRS